MLPAPAEKQVQEAFLCLKKTPDSISFAVSLKAALSFEIQRKLEKF